MIDKLFTYGTLEIPLVVRRVLGRDLSGQPAVLHDYARYLVRGESYPAICEEVGSSIRGTLYEGIDSELFRRLDKYEGEEYKKRQVDVVTEDAIRHLAFVYTCPASLLDDLPWSREVFERNHLENFMSSRAAWIE